MDTSTHLQRLELTNFRAFRSLSIDFEPRLTVLVAENGQGKTAVLDACAIALRYFVDTMQERPGSHGFERADVRQAFAPLGQMVEQTPTLLEAKGLVCGRPTAWVRRLTKAGGKTSSAEAKDLAARAKTLLSELRAYADGDRLEAPVLPVVAYYGTGRLWSEGRVSKAREAKATRFNRQTVAYADCLNPRSTFQTFSLWFEAASREAQEQTNALRDGGSSLAESSLRAVRSATNVVLAETGWQEMRWDFLARRIVAKHAQAGELPVQALSDGIRNAIALVADLAHRCVRLNPHLGEAAPSQTPGIVLIDEVDIHLHPRWQQSIVGLLEKAFPRVQFIVSTHSPQVLSTVPNVCVRVLRETPDGIAVGVPELQTMGVPSADALVFAMDVNPNADLAIRHDLDRYRAMIQDGRDEEAEVQTLRTKLEKHYGLSHPEVQDLERLRRFVAHLSRRARSAE